MIPERPANFAKGRAATASSSQTDHAPDSANDGSRDTRWTAASGEAEQWWQVDLGQVQSIKYLAIEFEREEKLYGYEIKVSPDAAAWETIVTKPTSAEPRWGGPKQIFHSVDTQARYVQIEFNETRENAWAAVAEFAVYPEYCESDYYDVTYAYRLRWNDVAYEPGVLKAVAYKAGKRIGEATMRTAGEPARLRLTPDRTRLSASGEDLAYILVEVLDGKGTLCPLAGNLVRFEIDGPAEIAGIGNGNPLSLELFQDESHELFHGKAMLILRTLEGQNGRIRVTARAEGLKDGRAQLQARR